MKLRSTLLAFICTASLAGCTRSPQQETPAPVPEATAKPPTSDQQTSQAAPLFSPRPTPVSETSAAQYLAASGHAPVSSAPQLIRAEPKELSKANPEAYELQGFNLTDIKIFARGADGKEIEFQPSSRSGESVIVPADQWQRLAPGNYSIIVRDEDGRTAELPVPLNIE